MQFYRLVMRGVLVLAFGALLVACGGGGGGGGGNNNDDDGGEGTTAGTTEPVTSLQMTLNDAQGLVITGEDGSLIGETALANRIDADGLSAIAHEQSGDELAANSLYKATTDGRLERVEWTGGEGEDIPAGTIVPTVVRELSSRFVAIGFEQTDEIGDMTKLSFLVEKATGLAFSEDPDAPGPLNYNLFETPRKHTTDREGNLYLEGFVPGEGYIGVYRIDAAGFGSGASVGANLLTGSDWSIFFWEIPHNGRFIAYQGETEQGNRVSRIRPTYREGLANVEIDLGNRMLLGTDGQIYAFHIPNEGTTEEEPAILYRLGLTDENGQLDAVLEEMERADPELEIAVPFSPERRLVGGRLIVIGRTTDTIYEVIPRDGYSQPIATLEDIFEDIRGIANTDRYLYVFADRSDQPVATVTRWDSRTGETLIFDPSEQRYEVLDFDVLASDRIWIRALETDTGDTVIAEVDSDGDVNVTARIPSTQTTIVLTPISPAQFIVIDGVAIDWSEDLLILTADSGAIRSLGAIADRGVLKLLVAMDEIPETGVRVDIHDGSLEHEIVFESDQGVFQYDLLNDDGAPPADADGEDWRAARGPDGFEFGVPLDILVDGASTLTIGAQLAEVDDDTDPVTVDLVGDALEDAVYSLP